LSCVSLSRPGHSAHADELSVQRGGKVEIIANDQGNRITPSWVAFTDEERLVGDAAKNQAPQNPENTVFDDKRLIGRNFDDPDVKKDQKHWPFKIVNKGGKPMIQVEHQNKLKDFVSRSSFSWCGWDAYEFRPQRRFQPWSSLR
jgi:molecular chaperone DnaK (HSP70)